MDGGSQFDAMLTIDGKLSQLRRAEARTKKEELRKKKEKNGEERRKK